MIALAGNSEGCCAPTECCGGISMTSPVQIAKNIGYDIKELGSIPESSILGVGCGAPVNFADIHEGEVVVDIGSGGGIKSYTRRTTIDYCYYFSYFYQQHSFY